MSDVTINTKWVREFAGSYVRGDQSIIKIGPTCWAVSAPEVGGCEYRETLRSAKECADTWLTL